MALFARATANKSLFRINFCSNLSSHQCRLPKSSSLLDNSSFFGECRRITTSSVRTIIPTSKFCGKQEGSGDDLEPSVEVFDKFLWTRRRESKRTVIIQVQSPNSYNDLYSYCVEFGPINSMHHYIVSKNIHFFLVEFKDLESHKAVLAAATHINHQDSIPTYSYMLWFRNVPRKSKKETVDIPPPVVATGDRPSEEKIHQELMSAHSISKQMELLHNMWQLDDVSTRLRFMTALQMEISFSSLFPNTIVLPFGSSVNGFGKSGCDLDLVMTLDSEKQEKIASRFVFQTKSSLPDERAQTQKSMEVISNVMQYFIPGIRNVRRILHARVPIIKYDHSLTGLECDLSMTNMSAVYMSELLYIFGEHDVRVRPLVFTIRQWATSVGITNVNPGGWITNFSLTLLVMFFLQHKKILPSINTMRNLARSSDVRLTETCIDCTFIRDPKMIPSVNSEDSLESLLCDFYNFYAVFDFSTKAICLGEGTSLYKPDTSPLFICNPLEKALNVSKNVTPPEVMRFINAVKNAAMLFEEGFEGNNRGILDIFAEKRPQKKYSILGRGNNNNNNNKKVRIAELFRDESVDKLNDEMPRSNQWKKERARRR
ncbi:poly(A) RNA polymerase, mitochondrial isoform X2 [Diachasma alloeum]|uniref:poly(A) RNA polymerase, mitochondrial isoform X2 n=1 Tax=Diachasma alloeum TaxID=454923 RepID=UPI0007382221|nr:poly(A) RNA polymerase, mitochondrial isoform X2 [Diachasma alloeum]